VHWQETGDDDAVLLADLASSSFGNGVSIEQVRAVLRSWRVDHVVERGLATAATAVLPPSPGHHRGYGAWWDRGHASPDRWHEIVARLSVRAATVADLDVLQVTASADDSVTASRLIAAGFEAAFPLWTMTHDGTSWPDRRLDLPAPLRSAAWAAGDQRSFHNAYAHAYEDQRLVEPHTAQTWTQLAAGESFTAAPARLAVTPEGAVVGFVLAFRAGHGGIELGPIGTVPPWRNRGVSSALLASVLVHCRDESISPVTLTVDGDSPTGAQRLYERFGFNRSETLTAFHRALK
jgi:ribosomal protein S18 acetylase RimI-like enzyme